MFTAWKNGPEDNSLEGRKKKLFEMPMVGDNEVPRPEKKPEQVISSPNRGVSPAIGGAETRIPKPEPQKPDISLDELPDHREAMGEGLISERQQMINDYKTKLRESFDLEDTMVDSQMLPVRNGIKKILSDKVNLGNGSVDDMRDQFISLMAMANTYNGRQRHGEGKRTMFYEDAQRLLDPDVQKMLLEGYGDGSPEQIAKFVESRKVADTSPQVIEQLWPLLNAKFKGALGSGNLGNTIKALQEDGTVANIASDKLHYGGENDRVGSGSTLRKKLLLKLFMDQAGRDGYTGNELDPRYMELEHVRGVNNLGEGEVAPTLEQVLQRENLKNWLWIGTGVNNEKSDLDMGTFLENVKKKHGGKGREDYVDLEAADKAFAERQTGIESLLEGMVQDGQLSEAATPEALQALFDNEMQEAAGMASQGIKKSPVGLGSALRKMLGMVKDRKLTRSQIKTRKELFKPLIMHIASLPPEERADAIKGYNEAFHTAADKTQEISAAGAEGLKDPSAIIKRVKGEDTLSEKGTWETMFIRDLVDRGLLNIGEGGSGLQHLTAGELKNIRKLLGEELDYEDYIENDRLVLL